MFPYEVSDALYSALATLPALNSIKLSNDGLYTRLGDDITSANAESMTELLRVPSLRSVCFTEFYFAPAVCQATANALMEGTAVTNLEFGETCSFSAEAGAAILASGLSRNISVISIIVQCSNARALIDALAAAVSSNATLQHLVLNDDDPDNDDFSYGDDPPDINDDPDLSPFFLALGKNTGLKTLEVHGGFGSMDESLCTAMKDGLGMNETLESLQLNRVPVLDESAALWCRALSFLRTSKTLKSLIVNLDAGATASCVSTLQSNIACTLQENASLESISIDSWHGCIKSKAEEYFVLITALQHNTRLKTLGLCRGLSIRLNDDESKQLVSLLKKNYVLESLPDINLKYEARDVGAILRLNAAGRRYLVQDGSSISKGVQVLSMVNDDINCVFLHLLENPRLCDPSAVEMAIAGESSDGSSSTNPNASSGEGKREQATAHKGKESRRRFV
jgi:hypothetical protein